MYVPVVLDGLRAGSVECGVGRRGGVGGLHAAQGVGLPAHGGDGGAVHAVEGLGLGRGSQELSALCRAVGAGPAHLLGGVVGAGGERMLPHV